MEPTFISGDGTKFWYFNDTLHREDGPAIEYPDGTKYWFLNGQRHREDGPACEYPDGTKYWFLNGELLSEDAFIEITKPKKTLAEQKKELVLQFLKYISSFGKENPYRYANDQANEILSVTSNVFKELAEINEAFNNIDTTTFYNDLTTKIEHLTKK